MSDLKDSNADKSPLNFPVASSASPQVASNKEKEASKTIKNEPVLMCLSQSNEEKMKSKNKLLPSFLINSLEIKEHFKKDLDNFRSSSDDDCGKSFEEESEEREATMYGSSINSGSCLINAPSSFEALCSSSSNHFNPHSFPAFHQSPFGQNFPGQEPNLEMINLYQRILSQNSQGLQQGTNLSQCQNFSPNHIQFKSTSNLHSVFIPKNMLNSMDKQRCINGSFECQSKMSRLGQYNTGQNFMSNSSQILLNQGKNNNNVNHFLFEQNINGCRNNANSMNNISKMGNIISAHNIGNICHISNINNMGNIGNLPNMNSNLSSIPNLGNYSPLLMNQMNLCLNKSLNKNFSGSNFALNPLRNQMHSSSNSQINSSLSSKTNGKRSDSDEEEEPFQKLKNFNFDKSGFNGKLEKENCIDASFVRNVLNMNEKELYNYIITQKGSRDCQMVLKKINMSEFEVLISKIKPFFGKIMTNKYGNYFSKKLIQNSLPKQRIELLKSIKDNFIEIANDAFGTHPLQILIEIINLPEEKELVLSYILGNELTLALDSRGTHVLQKFISGIKNEHLLQKLGKNILSLIDKLIMDQFGVCVLIQLVKNSKDKNVNKYVANYIKERNPLSFIQHPYANYVVQNLFNSADMTFCKEIVDCIVENYLSLSSTQQK